MSWQPEVLQYVRDAGQPGFASRLSVVPAGPVVWEHATEPEERGLEQWMLGLARFDRTVWITAAAAAARHAYPAVERAGAAAENLGMLEDDPSVDGEAAGTQLRRIEAWLEHPTVERDKLLEDSFDVSRQLNVWDEDLYPPPETMWMWFLEVGQLVLAAALHGEKRGGRGTSYYDWPGSLAAARCVVCALKTIRTATGSLTSDVEAIGVAIARAFGAT